MVLSYYDVHRSERVLRQMCKTKTMGTHPTNLVSAARAFGFESYLEVADLAALIALLERKVPPIITIFDEQDDVLISHALVVKRIDSESVAVLDSEEGQYELSLAEFDKLWSAAGHVVIVVEKQKTEKE